MAIKSFSKSTGADAVKTKGSFFGKLLGKDAEGLEALEAIKSLAEKSVNRFMELAIKAANVVKLKLEATRTIPFASPDMEFNPSIVAHAPKAPGLGGSARRSTVQQKPTQHRKDDS